MNRQSIPNRLATVAAVFAALAAAAGLVIAGLYRDAPYWVQQARGTDLATLFVAVPVLALGLWTARRGSQAGRLTVIAGLLYLAYNYAIFAFSVAMNPLTALHITIGGLAVWSLILAPGSALAEAGEALAPRLNRRLSAGLLIGCAVLFGLLWLGQIATTTLTGALPADIARAGISTNPVYALDLAIFLPLCVIAGIGLLRHSRAASLALPMLIWVPLMSAGILGGMVLAAVAGEEVPIVVVALVGGPGVASAILAAIAMIRSMHPANLINVTTVGGTSGPAVRGG